MRTRRAAALAYARAAATELRRWRCRTPTGSSSSPSSDAPVPRSCATPANGDATSEQSALSHAGVLGRCCWVGVMATQRLSYVRGTCSPCSAANFCSVSRLSHLKYGIDL